MPHNQRSLLWIVLAAIVCLILIGAPGLHPGVVRVIPKPVGSRKNFAKPGLGLGRPSSSRWCSCNNSKGDANGTVELPNAGLSAVADTKVRMFILANMRTGSSFVGDLVGSSHDVFYLFEPGLGLSKALEKREDTEQVLSDVYLRMLRRLYRCDFDQLDFYLQWLSRMDMETLQKMAPRLYDLCIKRRASRSCTVTQGMATGICRRSKYLVVKSIRIPDVALLRPMMEDAAINLKVTHLARDPRGMMPSRVRALTGTAMTRISESIKELLCLYCDSNLKNMVIGTQNPSMKDRYMFLRYEDAALDPVAASARIHRFLGRGEVPESVLKWIYANTKSEKPGTYSTARNSKKAYRAWRDDLPFALAKAIEGTGRCAEMMKRMGYLPLVDNKHLRNSSLSLLTSIASGNNDKNYDWIWDL